MSLQQLTDGTPGNLRTSEPQAIAEPADIVVVRRWLWRLAACVTYEHVTRARVDPLHANAPSVREFLAPFDRVRPERRTRQWRRVSRSWLFHVVTRWAGAWPVPVVAGAVAADVHLLGHQLGPVLALRHGLGCRFLLADAVGAGKTIEAALVLSELAARGLAHRVLVLTPATLRDQWRDELAHRAAISAGVIDRAAIRNRARDVAAEEGPWQPPGVHVMSTELAKQPDVLAGLCAVCWDAVIVDEAHGVAGDSARTAAVRAISARARVLLLLSATPHAGSDAAFSRLCSLGRLPGEPPPLVFARRRADGPPLRHRDVRTRPGTDERRYLRALTRYAVALERCSSPGAALAALVLRKRALSSPHALLCSLRHRLRCLRPLAGAVQDLLPFDDTGEQEHDDVDQPLVLGAAGFQDVTREIGVIEELLASIEAAGLRWSKADALLRLVRRTSERVLIFTEYRDTLTALAAMLSAETGVSALHGGLDRFARSEAIAQFTSGAVRIMVATDVAAEGLNLQHGCRLAVHVELPWSPARLEQRNGRVNRLGQTQRVERPACADARERLRPVGGADAAGVRGGRFGGGPRHASGGCRHDCPP